MNRLTLINGRYLLDTNIIIALFADEMTVKNSLAQAVYFKNQVGILDFIGYRWDNSLSCSASSYGMVIGKDMVLRLLMSRSAT
ncbi:hypothetical protein [Scytonema sp. PRP1]|uniref:hypothetical protein n=1 Tax=Scytonema sp. PRP1 TaxID=3120513 RepID=UPI002FCF74A3